MEKKSKIIYGAAVGTIAVGAAVALGVSASKDDRKATVIFNLGQQVNQNDEADLRTPEIKNYEDQNNIQIGEAIKEATANIDGLNWDQHMNANKGESEKLIRVDRDDLKAALNDNENLYTYYFAKVAPEFESNDEPESYDDAAEELTPQEKLEKGHELVEGSGEWINGSEKERGDLWKGQIPANYDNDGRFKDVVVGDDSSNNIAKKHYVPVDGVILHKVVMDSKTGEIISIQDEKGLEVPRTEIVKADHVISKTKFNKIGADGIPVPKDISYKEAQAAMAKLVDELGACRGSAGISKKEFENKEFVRDDVYSCDIAGIFDIPEYIKLLVDKPKGSSTVQYSLAFDAKAFPSLSEQKISFKHDIVLYNQPGGAIELLGEIVEFINKNVVPKTTYTGIYNGVKLGGDIDYKTINTISDGDIPGTVSKKAFLEMTGIPFEDLNWAEYAQKLPGLTLQYRIAKPITSDGEAGVQLKPVFKGHGTSHTDPISTKVTGITQAVVDAEQERINSDKTTHNIKVRDIKLDSASGIKVTSSVAKQYGIESLVDLSKFAYTLSHSSRTSDGTMGMKLTVSKGAIKTKVAATDISIKVSGINETKDLKAEQEFFNSCSSAKFHIDDIQYPAETNKVLTQGDLTKMGITHTIHTSKYTYTMTHGAVTSDGKHNITIKVTPKANIKVITAPKEFSATFTGIDDEKRRRALGAEQTRLNSLGRQEVTVSEISIPLMTEASKTKLTPELVKEYGLKGKDGNLLVLDSTMTYYIWAECKDSSFVNTDKSGKQTLVDNNVIDITIKVLDKNNPNLEVGATQLPKSPQTSVVPTSFEDNIKGITEQRSLATLDDAQGEINDLSGGSYKMSVDKIKIDEQKTPITLVTKDDFLKYGIDFDPTARSISKTLGTTFLRSGYQYELTFPSLNADGTLKMKISVVVVIKGVKTSPKTIPSEIDTQVSGINAAKALKAEQEETNTEAKNAKGNIFVWDREVKSVDHAELTKAVIDEYHLTGISLESGDIYKYSVDGIDKSGNMKMTIYVSKANKQQFGTPESFDVAVTGIKEYKEFLKALADVQTLGDNSKSSPIEYEVHELKLAAVDEKIMTPQLITDFNLGFTPNDAQFEYKYSIEKDIDSDTDFVLKLIVKSKLAASALPVTIEFTLHTKGIDSAKEVQADLDSIAGSYEVTQPIAGTVTEGYNTKEYNVGDQITQDDFEHLVKDNLQKVNPDVEILPTPVSGITRTYKIKNKDTDTMTIEVSDTDGDFTTVNDVILTGFISGTSKNNLGYPSEIIAEDLKNAAAGVHKTAATLPVSAHTNTVLSQKWVDYLGLGITYDSRFGYTFSNILTDSGEMDVTVVATNIEDPSIKVTQLFKVEVSGTKLDKVYFVNTFSHAELADAQILNGMPQYIIDYVHGLTDQFRGFEASYSMPKIVHNTNSVTPLTITLKSKDDPTNIYTFKVFIVTGDPSKVSGDAKTLADAGNTIDDTTTVPTVIAEPTTDEKAIISSVISALKANLAANTVIEAEGFLKIAAGSDLTQSILTELNIPVHIGSAIGLMGDEFTVSTDKALTSNGDVVLTITPKDGSGDISITVSVTGIDEYKKVEEDLDALESSYKVEPRNGDLNNNEYVPWSTKLTDDQLQRLTAVNEWTQAALDESVKEVIRAPKDGIVRHIVIKSKTATEMVLEITDTLGGASYSKQITLTGFVAGTTANDLRYLHEVNKAEFSADAALAHTWNNFVGDTIPKVTDEPLTQDALDYFGLHITLSPDVAYSYSTNKELSSDGTVKVTIKAVYSSGKELTQDIDYTVNFADYALLIYAGHAPDTGDYQESDLTADQIKELHDQVPGLPAGYIFKDIHVTDSDSGFAKFTATIFNPKTRFGSPVSGNYLPAEVTGEEIAHPGGTGATFYYKANQEVDIDAANKLVGDGHHFGVIPDGYKWHITVATTGGKGLVYAQLMKGGSLFKSYSYAFEDFTGTTNPPSMANTLTYVYNEVDKDIEQAPLSGDGKAPVGHSLTDRFRAQWYVTSDAHPTLQKVRDSMVAITYKHTGDTPERQVWYAPFDRATSTPSGKLLAPHASSPIWFEWYQRHLVLRTPSHPSGTPPKNFELHDFKTNTGGMPLNGWVDVGDGWQVYVANYDDTSTNSLDNVLREHLSEVNRLIWTGTGASERALKQFDRWEDNWTKNQRYLNGILGTEKTRNINVYTDTDAYNLIASGEVKKFRGHDALALPSKANPPAVGTVKPAAPTTYKEFPVSPTDAILESIARTKLFNIKGFVDAEEVKTASADIPIPQWLIDGMKLHILTDQTVTVSLPAITGDGPVSIVVKYHDAAGDQTFTINANIMQFDAYNASLADIKASLATLADTYAAEARSPKGWTTNEYNVGDTLTPEQVQRLTAVNEWSQAAKDETAKEVIRPIDPATGITRTVTVKSKTTDTLVLTIVETKGITTLTKEVTLTGFIDDASITTNDLRYAHEMIADTLGSLADFDITDSTSAGIPILTDVPMTKEIALLLGLDLPPENGFDFTVTTTADATDKSKYHVAFSATFKGQTPITGEADFTLAFKTQTESATIAVPDVSVLTVGATDLPQAIKDYVTGNLPGADRFTYKVTAVADGKVEFDLTDANGATSPHWVYFVADTSDVTPDATVLAKQIIYHAGDIVTLDQANSLLPTANKLHAAPAGAEYSITLEDKDPDTIMHVLLHEGPEIVTKFDLVLKGLKTEDPNTMKGLYTHGSVLKPLMYFWEHNQALFKATTGHLFAPGHTDPGDAGIPAGTTTDDFKKTILQLQAWGAPMHSTFMIKPLGRSYNDVKSWELYHTAGYSYSTSANRKDGKVASVDQSWFFKMMISHQPDYHFKTFSSAQGYTMANAAGASAGYHKTFLDLATEDWIQNWADLTSDGPKGDGKDQFGYAIPFSDKFVDYNNFQAGNTVFFILGANGLFNAVPKADGGKFMDEIREMMQPKNTEGVLKYWTPDASLVSATPDALTKFFTDNDGKTIDGKVILSLLGGDAPTAEATTASTATPKADTFNLLDPVKFARISVTASSADEPFEAFDEEVMDEAGATSNIDSKVITSTHKKAEIKDYPKVSPSKLPLAWTLSNIYKNN